jgi:hypothetical protein
VKLEIEMSNHRAHRAAVIAQNAKKTYKYKVQEKRFCKKACVLVLKAERFKSTALLGNSNKPKGGPNCQGSFQDITLAALKAHAKTVW